MGQFAVEPAGKGVIIRMTGAVFRDSLPVLEDIWQEQLIHEPSFIAFDCSELSQIDSSVIGTLVKYNRLSGERGIDLVFYNISPNIRQLFTVTGMDRFMTVMTQKNFQKRYLGNV